MESRIEEDWEIVDYYPSLEDEQEYDKSKLGWVIDKGLNVGKKLAITGVVISSVPLLLPPLVVISALGFAFSVPYGVVFASYACTQKLMSKLLPSPPLSDVLDFNQTVGLHEEDDQEPEIAVEKEEKEENQAIKDGIELVDIEYAAAADDDSHRDDTREEQEGLAGDKLEVGGVNEEEERDQHSMEQDMDEKPSFNIVKTEDYTGDRKYEGENNGEDVSFDVQVQSTDEFMENEGEKNAMDKKDKEKFSQEKNEKVEKIITETKKRSKEIESRGKKKNLGSLQFHGKRKESKGDERHGEEKELLKETKASSENNVEGELGLGETFATEETSRDEFGVVASGSKQAGEKEGTLLESEDLDHKQNHDLLLNDDIGHIDSSLDKEEENVGLKDGAIRETAEGESANGRVVEEKIEVCTVMVQDESGVNYNESRIIADDGDYSLEVAEHDEETLHLKEEKDACGVDGGLHSDEELFRDEKIWEKIDAIRVIVGFKAPRRLSYYEELKSLYLFTGIEPPSTSSDPCDFAEFYSKLCFLMSVIGLK